MRVCFAGVWLQVASWPWLSLCLVGCIASATFALIVAERSINGPLNKQTSWWTGNEVYAVCSAVKDAWEHRVPYVWLQVVTVLVSAAAKALASPAARFLALSEEGELKLIECAANVGLLLGGILGPVIVYGVIYGLTGW